MFNKKLMIFYVLEWIFDFFFFFYICQLAVAFYVINEIQSKRKFKNIVQCPFKVLQVLTQG